MTAGTDDPIFLSLVLPAFNEELRIGRTLEAASTWFAAKPYRSEILVVLDGCVDQTAAVVARHSGVGQRVVVRSLENSGHRGKGASVRQGMLAARGRLRFFTDADLAYPLRHIDEFVEVLQREGGIAIAARDTASLRYASLARQALALVSRGVMSRLFVPGIADTQAGLKGFVDEVAVDLFSRQRLDGFGFDVEILRLAQLLGRRITALPVTWQDVPGSKVRPARDVPRMALDLGRILAHQILGHYRRD